MFAKFIGSFFGIEYNHPHSEAKSVFTLKKTQTPFLERVITSIKEKKDDLYK
jgi:hypothetical protein